MLNSQSAGAWLKIYHAYRRERDLNNYYQWDVAMPIELRRKYGVHCYISYKCYGEHGGFPNYEHTLKGFRAWHQAESLANSLEFLPAYARNSHLRYLGYRLRARLRGIYKLLMGKYFDGWGHFMRLKPDRWKKLLFVLRRVLT